MLERPQWQDCFSCSYEEARRRFRDAAARAGMDLRSYPVDVEGGENLTIDVAVRGRAASPSLVVSSGVHGVEGFAGSALQLAFLEGYAATFPGDGLRVVLVHGVNPYGFAHVRRFNEDNVDLNRNFIEVGGRRGLRDGYARLNRLLNPESPPSRMDPFAARIAFRILKAGRAKFRDASIRRGSGGLRDAWSVGFSLLKEAVACGQYEYPRGLFFGGREPSRSMRIVQEHCKDWIGDATRVLHFDVHTGLGRFGSYRLLLGAKSSQREGDWVRIFGDGRVESLAAGETVAFPATGSFADWMQRQFRDQDYQAAALEFGTYPPIRVLRALRAENRVHHYCGAGDPRLDRARRNLMEAFCPRRPEWRRRVVSSGLVVIEQARRELLKPREPDRI